MLDVRSEKVTPDVLCLDLDMHLACQIQVFVEHVVLIYPIRRIVNRVLCQWEDILSLNRDIIIRPTFIQPST